MSNDISYSIQKIKEMKEELKKQDAEERIKELEGGNERLRGDAAEAEGVIGELLNALLLSHEHMKLHIRNYNEGWYVYDCVVSTLALAKARGEV